MVSKDLRLFLLIASFMMILNISIGAFGAHGLKPYLDDYSRLIFAKAVSYSFYNTLGLFASNRETEVCQDPEACLPE